MELLEFYALCSRWSDEEETKCHIEEENPVAAIAAQYMHAFRPIKRTMCCKGMYGHMHAKSQSCRSKTDREMWKCILKMWAEYE